MDLHLIFRHMQATDGLRSYTEEKVDKLTKYLIKPSKMNIIFSVERFNHKVDITLFEKNHTFKSQGESNDMYASVDQAIHNLEEQMRRHKEKLKDHKNFKMTPESQLLSDEDTLKRFYDRVPVPKKKIA